MTSNTFQWAPRILLLTFALTFSLSVSGETAHPEPTEIPVLIEKAEAGDVDAMVKLAMHFSLDNPKLSADYVKMAADHGMPWAMHLYAMEYARNNEERQVYLEKAHARDHRESTYALGEALLSKGQTRKAIRFFELAASEQSRIGLYASFRLFLIYEFGQVVPRDSDLADQWEHEATKQYAALNRQGHNLSYTPVLVLTDSGTYIDLINTMMTAKTGDPKAQFDMASLYVSGRTIPIHYVNYPLGHVAVPQSGSRFTSWVNSAMLNGHAGAAYLYALALHQGISANDTHGAHYGGKPVLEPSPEEAARYYRIAAKMGVEEARIMADSIGSYKANPWNQESKSSATWQTSHKLDEFTFVGSASYSKGGEKALYFYLVKDGESNCRPENPAYKIGEQAIWHFNGQAVEMRIYCGQIREGAHALYAGIVSDKGARYVVDLFKRTAGSVEIEGFGHTFPISAQGFTRVWNSVTEVL